MTAAMGNSIQRYPLLRLLVFYICGIYLADVLYSHISSLVLCGLWSCWSLLMVLLLVWAYRREVLFGVVASGLFLMLGMWNYSWTRSRSEYEWPEEKLKYEVRVVSTPRVRERSILCEVEVEAVCDSDSSAWTRIGRKVFAYMEPCDGAEALMPGDMLCFKGVVRTPQNFSDSLTFDYARYVTMQGASGTVYLPRNRWIKVGEGRGSLRERMLRLRQSLFATYMTDAFSGDALGVLSALTLGDKRGLSVELREAYNDAGAAHVLALSGMHVGVIYGMIVLLLRGLMRRRSLRWIRELLAVLVLWSFALLVGMPASVARAVVLCSLYAFTRWVSDGTSSSLHMLSLTALLMLFVCPLYLFDVGFQLSFMAMAAILWIEPYMELLLHKHTLHPICGYFVGIVCMSLAAQLGTFPLVLYHFGSFPVYFLLSNLIVVPALFVILLLMIAWWMLTLTGCSLAQPLGLLLQSLVEWNSMALKHISHWPGAVLYVGNYHAITVFFTYLFILFTGLFILRKWPRAIVFALAALLGILICFLF